MLTIDDGKLATLNGSNNDRRKFRPIKILGYLLDIRRATSPNFTLVCGVYNQLLGFNPLKKWRRSRGELGLRADKSLCAKRLVHRFLLDGVQLSAHVDRKPRTQYRAGLRNLCQLYLPLADVAAIYDNSDEGRVLIAERMPETSLAVHDAARWAMIEKATP